MSRSAVISETKRKIREVNPGNIPDFLKQVPRWVVWKAFDHDNGARFSKIPIHPKLGFKISFQSKKNHLRFDDALEGYSKGLGDGIGIVLTDAPISTADQFTPKYLIGVDLDNVCESDEKRFQAKKLCKSIGSYCEISPSGTGIRIFALSEVPLGRGQSPKGEMYNNNRFLTVTGNGKKRSVIEATQALMSIDKDWWPEKRVDRSIANDPHSDDCNVVAFKLAMYADDWPESPDKISGVQELFEMGCSFLRP